MPALASHQVIGIHAVKDRHQARELWRVQVVLRGNRIFPGRNTWLSMRQLSPELQKRVVEYVEAL